MAGKTCHEYVTHRSSFGHADELQFETSRNKSANVHAGYSIDPSAEGSSGHSRFIAEGTWRMSCNWRVET